MPLWFADRGLSAAAIGQVLGFASLFRVMSGPGWGTMADRVGRRRPVMTTAAVIAMTMSLSYLPLHGFLPILLVAAIQGIAASALGPLAELAGAGAGARGQDGIRAGARGWLDFLHGDDRRGRAGAGAAGRHAGAVDPGCWAMASPPLFARLLPEAETPPAAPHVLGGWALFRLQPFRLTVACTALIQGSHAAYYGFAAIYWRSQGIGDAAIGLLFAEGDHRGDRSVPARPAAGGAVGPGGPDGLRRGGRRGALERHGAGAAAAGAGGAAIAACGDVRDAASGGDDAAEPDACRPSARRRPRRCTRRWGRGCRTG